jgi:hypothetical protein
MQTSFMLGGGKLKLGKLSDNEPVKMIILIFLFIILKVLVVQYTYNTIAPVITQNAGGDVRKFKPLTFEQSLTFIVFIMFLF